MSIYSTFLSRAEVADLLAGTAGADAPRHSPGLLIDNR
jgi:hypothetical protein